MNDNKLWKAFSEFIRLRDANKDGICFCFTCGRPRHWKRLDCGHGISRRHLATKYNEMNNHAQCKECNAFEGGKREVYKEKVNQKYGKGTWERIEIASKLPMKFTQFEVDQMEIYYKQKVKELKKQK